MVLPRGFGMYAVLLLLGCARVDGAPAGAPRPPEFVPGEYIVTVRGGSGAETLGEVYAAHGIEKLQPLGQGRFLVRLADDPGLEAARRVGLQSADITAVERNFVYHYQR